MAIKKGDRLIWTDQGHKRPVVATTDECQGNVHVEGDNIDKGTYLSVQDLSPADD